MQGTSFWSGYDWPESIDWIAAVLGTLLGASDRSFTEILIEYDGSLPGSYFSGPTIDGEISRYYSQVESFFKSENVGDIFGQAYDDAQWVVLEWLEVIKFINEYNSYINGSDLGEENLSRYAHRAHVFYNIVQNEFETSLCDGGITWNPTLETYKNAITNELYLSSSIAMYLYFPGDYNTDPYPTANYSSDTNTTLPPLTFLQPHDPVLLDNAIKEYDWFKTHNFTNEQGLIVDGFHISKGQTTCDKRNEMVYTYNQGVILSGLRGLWEATGDPSYLSDGYDLVNTVIDATGWNAQDASEASQWSGLGRNGIMEDYCDASANCSQDAQIFKGIYFHHLGIFCEPLPTITPLVANLTVLAEDDLAASHSGHCDGFRPWVIHNANAALSTRDQNNVIGGWWGSAHNNGTEGATLDMSVPRPEGSWDERNDPSVLDQAPWACRDADGCRQGRNGNALSARYVKPSAIRSKKRDVNDGGRGRTVETQGSGVGVVKAASDFTRKRPA
ncbi:hypothetical protein WHR41_06335 [Cladosporium halotolerans]|uniref:Glycoside hydrolase family 76 protein n=1 Tax=Cladosporium halotolerans TaxID=1052096 RepID=A0AB34KMC9_9PEZI